jgi:hypothetical protein
MIDPDDIDTMGKINSTGDRIAIATFEGIKVYSLS